MDGLIGPTLVVLFTAALCAVAWKMRLLTPPACVCAFAMAVIIGLTNDIWWTLAFFVFPVAGFIATKIHFKEKEEHGLQEGEKGERHLLNILGVGTIPTVIALVHSFSGGCGFELTIAYISALAVSTSDTVASEMGVMDERAYMITTLKPCEVGINGGVSRFGMLVSVASALLFSLIAYDLIMKDLPNLWPLVPAVAGIAGNLMDSVFGAVFENRGMMSKYTVNASSALIGAVIGFLLAYLL